MHRRWLLSLLLVAAPQSDVALAAAPPTWHVAGIPPEVLLDVTEALRIVLHDESRDAPAYYLPATRSGAEAPPYRLWREANRSPALPEDDARPDGQPPMLVLYEPTFLVEGQLLPLAALPVDSAEYLLHALLLADLDLLADRRSPEWRRQADDRATGIFGDLPPAERRTAYADACATFGSHLASIANEIGRLAARHHDLCRSLEPPVGLFRLWARLFSDEEFAVSQPPSAAESETNGAPQLVSLPLSDRMLYLRLALGVSWTGVPEVDFSSTCPPERGLDPLWPPASAVDP